MELILAPMVETAKEAIGSMGDDTPLAVISDKPRLISQFFRQNFSQVTNPPIDSLRERQVMTLRTRFGNLANILDPEGAPGRVLVLESPVLTNADWYRLRAHFGAQAAEIDCTFEAKGGPDALRAAITRIRYEAEQAVRAGCTELFLTDEHLGADKVAIAGVLAAAAVHTHLVRRGLRSYASVNVRSAECLDTHYYAVLIGVGATTVNAYLAEASIADRQARGLFGDLSLAECLERHRKAIDEGLLKILSKMGIAVISSYRGGYNFEAVGLSRALVNDLFPGMQSGSDLVASQISLRKNDLKTASMIRNATDQRFEEQTAATEALRGRLGDIDKYNIKGTTNVHFDTGKAELSAQDKAELCTTATTAEGTENALLLVVGYTDSTGSDDVNQELSEKRANRVINYLQQKCGWKPYRMLTPTGMATADPLASNDTAEGKAQNRRVAVNILVSKSVDVADNNM